MRVEESRISKANICPYVGREIPGWEALGLDPDRIYQLFRDPKELEKAASTFDGKPLLIRHVAVTADLPNKNLWVGTIGACTFEAPYLVTRPLTVITREAQELIESEEQRELSAGYRYDAEMIPGTHGGERYDGRMVNIQGNHVAIVTKGRAGPDVHVADELPAELQAMKHGKRIARLQKRIPALAALSADDLLALDAELGETPAKSVITLTGDEEKAACDEALTEKRKTAGEDAELTEAEREAAMEKARDKKAKDKAAADKAIADKAAKDKKAKDKAAKDKAAKDKAAKDEEEEQAAEDAALEEKKKTDGEDAELTEEEKEAARKSARDKRAKDSDPDHRKDFNSIKQGNDAALTMDEVNTIVDKAVKRASAVTAAKVREEVTAQQRALAIACDEVTPLVGKVQLHAFDSAEEVYAFTLEKMGVELDDDFPAAGYRALVKNELKHRQTTRKPTSKHAMDSSANGFDADALFQRAG
jgi:uncharacterized protein